jgi:hypothetical protein
MMILNMSQVKSRHGKSLDCRALGGEIARVLKLAIPELVFANLDGLVVMKPMKKFKILRSQGLNLACIFQERLTLILWLLLLMLKWRLK